MKFILFVYISLFFCCCIQPLKSSAQHEIIFCGEIIPVNNSIVSGKLMDVIRKQIKNINMPALRKRANDYFPYIENYLQQMNLPADLKYIPIVESGFQNLTSSAGASGFWQLMPATASGFGMNITPNADERNDFYKSTKVACKAIISNYRSILNQYKISSWVLTMAAYNFGISNISKVIKKQRVSDYFSMDLNAETAAYVYKIIAVKELFEYPEFYMKDFGFNIFNAAKNASLINLQNTHIDTSAFNAVVLNISTLSAKLNDSIQSEKPEQYTYVGASITGKYKEFTDGQLITFKLQKDLMLTSGFNKKGNPITGTGWLIDGRIYIDLGYSDHDVVVISANTGEKGIELSELKKDETIMLKIKNNDRY